MLLPVFTPVNTPILSFRNHYENNADGSSYTFTAADIGNASANRCVVVGVGANAGSSFTSVTLGGSAMTSLVAVSNATTNVGALYILAFPTGATADVVVTCGAAANRCYIGVWSIYNLKSATAVATASATTSGGSMNVNTSSGGIVIGYHYNGNNVGTPTWTGLTQDYATNSTETGHSGASASNVVAATPRTVSVSNSSASTLVSVAASLR